MNARERVLAVLNRAPVDRIPVDIWHTPEIYTLLAEHFGVRQELRLYQRMGLDKIVWSKVSYLPKGHPEQQPVTDGGDGTGRRTMWGVPIRVMNTGTATYDEFGEPPLRQYKDPAALKDYPYWPEPERLDYNGLTENLREASKQFVTNSPQVSLLETYCRMRGMETAMLDLMTAPELVDAALDRIEECQTEMMKRLFAKAGAYIDTTCISDDVGGQNGLLISPDTWDRFFRARVKRWCELIHSYDVKVFYHSDGSCAALIPRLIDAGIDVLNPIQHICPGMDMTALKDSFGDRLIFHGGVENQRVLPFGSVHEVRNETLRCLRTLGRNRAGYICCSCHNIQPGTPLGNILAMVATVQAEGAR